jgi:DNA-binding XRE family transcriptional regulator
MSRKFRDFMNELKAEARSEGSQAVEELEAFGEHFRLARELAEARRAKGLTQAQLASKCGVDQSEISNLERGHANPTLKTLRTVARSLEFRIGLVALAPQVANTPARSRGNRRKPSR